MNDKQVAPIDNGGEERYNLFNDEELANLNWELLKFKQPFKRGKELRLEPEYTDKAQKKLRNWFDMPNVLPVKMKEGADQAFFNELDW